MNHPTINALRADIENLQARESDAIYQSTRNGTIARIRRLLLFGRWLVFLSWFVTWGAYDGIVANGGVLTQQAMVGASMAIVGVFFLTLSKIEGRQFQHRDGSP